MERRSLIGPLILIAIGALWLAHNIWPGFDASGLFRKYWPFLLIAWGVLRLVEILALASQGRTLRRGMSGGEFFVAALICVVGLAMTLPSHGPRIRIEGSAVEIFGEAYDYPVDLKQAVRPGTRLVIDNLNGNVRVVGGDTAEVTVAGRTTVRSLDRSSADELHGKLNIEFTEEGDRVTLRTNHERVPNNQRIATELNITVPRSMTVETRGRSGDVDVSGLDGSVEVVSERGDLNLSRIGGGAKLSLNRSGRVSISGVGGNVEIASTRGSDLNVASVDGEVTVSGGFSGDLTFSKIAKPLRFSSRNSDMRVERIDGSFSMDLGDLNGQDVTGPVRIHTKSRDINLDRFTGPLDIQIERGDINLNPAAPLEQMSVRCQRSGDIRLTVPEKARFALDAVAERGNVENQAGGEFVSETRNRESRLRSKSPGGPAVNLSTARGTITLQQR